MKCFLLTLVAATATSLVTAQADGNAAAPAKDLQTRRLAKLQRGLEQVVAGRNLSFHTKLERVDAVRETLYKQLGRRFPKPAPITVRGAWVGDLLYHKCNKNDEMLVRGRRRIVRSGKTWEPTLDRLAGGKMAPFLFDPSQFARVLLMKKLPMVHQTVGMFENQPVEIYTLSYKGEAAALLGRAGVYPADARTLGSSTITAAGFAAVAVRVGAGAAPAKRKGPEVDVDIALFVEPGRGTLLHAKVRAYSKSPMVGRMRGALGRGRAGGQDEEEVEEEEVQTHGKDGKRLVKNGLPVRKTKDMIVSQFDVTFAKHGTAAVPELDTAAKSMLGLAKAPK